MLGGFLCVFTLKPQLVKTKEAAKASMRIKSVFMAFNLRKAWSTSMGCVTYRVSSYLRAG